MAIELDLQIAVADGGGLPGDGDFVRWIEATLATARKDGAEIPDEPQLTVRLVDEAEIAALNATYRNKPKATNVLSFPFDAPPGVEFPLLGDIIICAAVVQREAAEQGKAPHAHWAHMTVHGVLHLLGYDHIVEQEAECMEGLETTILTDLGYTAPYE